MTDPLDGYRGYEHLDQAIEDLLVSAGTGADGIADTAQLLSDAQAINQFIGSPAGKLLLARHDEAVGALLRALTADDYTRQEVLHRCEAYRVQALSFGALLRAVQEAAAVQQQMEDEQMQDQQATDVNEP